MGCGAASKSRQVPTSSAEPKKQVDKNGSEKQKEKEGEAKKEANSQRYIPTSSAEENGTSQVYMQTSQVYMPTSKKVEKENGSQKQKEQNKERETAGKIEKQKDEVFVSQPQEEKLEGEADYRKLFETGQSKEDLVPCEVYHCTLKKHAESILKQGFRFPIKGKTANCGWKLGYAVYFGMQPKYCVHEALNTFREQGKNPDKSELAMIQVHVTKGKYRALGDYEGLSGKCCMSRDRIDVLTEQLDKAIVARFGYDTITINEGSFAAEVVVYDKKSIGKMEILPAAQFV